MASLLTLYVGDLHPDVTEATLFYKFSTVGPLLSIRVCRDSDTHRSLGYGYINFKRHSDAQQAIDTMQHLDIKGKPIRLSWSQSDPGLRNSGVGNLFVKNIDKSVGSKIFHDKFSAFGNILSYKLATDDNGVSKGYGYVQFETEEAANRAINEINGLMLNGRNLYVGKFIPRKERGKELRETDNFTNVYIKNFGEDLDDEKLCKMFEQFGKITSHKVTTNAEGKSKGFGFVSFSSADAAAKAVATMNGHVVKTKPLYVAFAEKREVRKAHLATQHLQGQDAHAHMPSQPLPESFNGLQTARIRTMPCWPAQPAQAIPGGYAPAGLNSMQAQVHTNASHSTTSTSQANFIGSSICNYTFFGQQPVLGASMVAGGPMGSGPAAAFIATDQQQYVADGRGHMLPGRVGVVGGGSPAGYNSTANRCKSCGGDGMAAELGIAQQQPGWGWRTT